MEDRLLRHATPIKHYHHMLETHRGIFEDLFYASRRLPEDGKRVKLLDCCSGEELADLGEFLIASDARLNPLSSRTTQFAFLSGIGLLQALRRAIGHVTPKNMRQLVGGFPVARRTVTVIETGDLR